MADGNVDRFPPGSLRPKASAPPSMLGNKNKIDRHFQDFKSKYYKIWQNMLKAVKLISLNTVFDGQPWAFLTPQAHICIK